MLEVSMELVGDVIYYIYIYIHTHFYSQIIT